MAGPYLTVGAMLGRLAARAEGGEDHQDTLAWVANLLATCREPGQQPLLHELEDGRGGSLLLPLQCGRQRFGPFAPRVLRSLTNLYSCRYQPLGLTADPAALFARWGRQLRRGPQRPDSVVLEALEPETARTLGAGLGQAGYWVEPVARFGNWYLPVAGLDFASYWAGRPSRLRHTVERKEKRLTREHRVTLQVWSAAADAAPAIAAYSMVDQRSWKQPEPHPGFMPGLIAGGLAAGRLLVGLLSVDERPAAAQVWLIANRRATIFKLSYDQAFKAASAGSILTRQLIQRALEAGQLDEIDFGRGDDPYKPDWLPLRRQRWSIHAYDPLTPLGLLLGARNLLPARLRRFRPGAGTAAAAVTGP